MSHGDKLYLKTSEWSALGGPKAASRPPPPASLPYSVCALTSQPWTSPLLAPSGDIGELTTLLPFVKRHGVSPFDGKPCSLGDLIPLVFVASPGGGGHLDPCSGKPFTRHSRLVAIRTSGNVFDAEVVEALNLRPKNYVDLVSDSPFTRADVVVVADPGNPTWVASHNPGTFYFRVSGVPLKPEGGADPDGLLRAGPGGGLIRLNEATRRVMAEVDAAAAAAGRGGGGPGISPPPPSGAGEHVTTTGVRTTGAFSGSLTSTGLSIATRNVAAPRTASDVNAARWAAAAASGVTRPGYARIHVGLDGAVLGVLNIELCVAHAPRTVDNWIRLAVAGAYDGLAWHRSVKNFMVQGGDPTGTGSGGVSGFPGGAPFRDEFSPKLSHDARGVLSMANSGPDSNKSQFFITFKPAPHLDGKHTVFGKVVGGADVLRAMELVPTRGGKGPDADRPTRRLTMDKVEVLVNPFEGLEVVPAAPARVELAPAGSAGAKRGSVALALPPVGAAGGGTVGRPAQVVAPPVGSLLPPPPGAGEGVPVPPPSKRSKSGGFGEFAGWDLGW